jgi:hypothetical protein
MSISVADYPRDKYKVYFETIMSSDRWTVRLYSCDSGDFVEEQSGLGDKEAAAQFIVQRMAAYVR